MKIKHLYRAVVLRILAGIILMLLFSGCQVVQEWKIERINKIPEKNAEMEEELIEKQAKDMQKQNEKEYRAALKEHKMKQSEGTKSHMKYLKKRSAYANKYKKRSFCDRLFNPGCR